MIYTEAEIEQKVSQCGGTWVKHQNLRRKLICESNDELTDKINAIQKEIRKLKAGGATQQELRGLYADITKLEVQIL